MDRTNTPLARGWSGYIGEVIAFADQLDEADRNKMVRYLVDKWDVDITPAVVEPPVRAFTLTGLPPIMGGDPLFSEVGIQLPMTGDNDSTSIIDVSNNGLIVTANGNAKISTARTKWGGGSLRFDGSAGTYLSVSDDPAIRAGADDFTAELWLWLDPSIGTDRVIAAKGGAYPGWMLYYGGSRELVLYASSNGTSWNVASQVYFQANPARGEWHHLQISRYGGAIHGGLNGTRRFSITTSATLADGTGPLMLGGTSGGGFILANMNDFRLTIGTGRYTGSTYDVPSGPLPSS
jgi:hypothetical protein